MSLIVDGMDEDEQEQAVVDAVRVGQGCPADIRNCIAA